jgi:pantetheine-phosphate adenylyltransferase
LEGNTVLRIFVYPGSFDPVTNGHVDIVKRALKLCDKLILAIGHNENKRPLFSVDERIEMLRAVLADCPEVEITSFSGLLIDFVKKVGSTTIIKGLRALSDFEYEFQMALLNKYLSEGVETLFMMTNVNYSYISSSFVKEIAKNGGRLDGLVPECITDKIMGKYGG